MSNRAHERSLARARARREQEDRQSRRRRVLAGVASAAILVAAGGFVYFFAWGSGGEGQGAPGVACGGTLPEAADSEKPTFAEPPAADTAPQAGDRATITTSCGDIVVELLPEHAPATVENFVALAERDYYAGITFHRVIPGFMIQGGDPTGTGAGDPGYTIRGELAGAEALGYERGVVAMANRGNDPDTASTQFFIVHGDASHLPARYAVFGRVVEGMETVDEIAAIPTDAQDRPTDSVYIEDVRVETAS